ncbi:hypothetical protein ONZ45_g7345 [Pleurotus djamor]|nr:hypothetical protein ONZ45_g7345 [Pleurotus djamor]
MNFRGSFPVFLVLGIALAAASSPANIAPPISDEESKSTLRARDGWGLRFPRSFAAEAIQQHADGDDVPKRKGAPPPPPPPPPKPKSNKKQPTPKAKPGSGKQPAPKAKPGPGKQQTKSNKPAKNGASCAIRRRGILIGKRAFDPGCDEASLTLGGVTKPIKKVGQQGNSAITYQVTGGWPDPTNGQVVTAYAKTGKTPAETFASEIKWLGKTDQLLAEGKFGDRQFIVFHGVSGKKDIVGTTYWKNLAEKFMRKGDIAGCEAEVKKTLLPLILKEAKVYVDKYKVLHTDVQPGNVLWDAAGTDPTLIDWGRAEEVAAWDNAIADRVTKQATFSFLKGDEKICHDLR